MSVCRDRDIWPACLAACGTGAAPRQALDDHQQTSVSQAVREIRTMPSGRRWGLIHLGAACMVSQLGQALVSAAGQSMG